MGVGKGAVVWLPPDLLDRPAVDAGRLSAPAGSVRFQARRTLIARVEPVLPVSLALAAVALCTWVSFRLGQNFAFTGFVFLIVVVLASLYGGFVQATVVSVAAVCCLNYYFVPPVFSFANSPANWVALGAFEFTALVIGRLSMRAQLRAREAVTGQRDMERLYQTSRRILLLDSSREAGKPLAALIRDVFDLRAVQLFDAGSGETFQDGETVPLADHCAREAYFTNTDTYDAVTQSWHCSLRLGTRTFGGLALSGTDMSKSAATALASLCAIAFERVRARQREFQAQAARQTEQLRTAVLDALAHEFKTPLTVARTASSGLLALGGLSELQSGLVSAIDRQVTVLDRLASRLLRSAALEGADFRMHREPHLFSEMTMAAAQSLEPGPDRNRIRVLKPGAEAAVFADRDLIVTSISQILDNALKYSEPESSIEAHFVVSDSDVVMTIRNKGLVLAPKDRERIFERFYRAPDTHHMPSGTGLGLSIVKKIAQAHRGSVWAEGEPGYGTAISLSLPIAPAG